MSYYAIAVEKVGDRITALRQQLSDTQALRDAMTVPVYGLGIPGPTQRLKPRLAQWWGLIDDLSGPADGLPAWQGRTQIVEELSQLTTEILDLKQKENTLNEAAGLDQTIRRLESDLARAEGEYFDLTNEHFPP